MAEEDVKMNAEQANNKDAVKDSQVGQPAKNDKRRKSSLKTGDDGQTKAQTPAQREAAKESQMHETFHEANNDNSTAADRDGRLAKDTEGQANNNQSLDRSSTDLSGENDRSELDKPEKQEDLFPGDEIIPDAVVVYDQKRTVRAPAAVIFPWLLQLGKDRGGWYMPNVAEKVLPFKWRASRTIESKWQRLIPGERLPDYGFGQGDFLVVDRVQEPHTIVFRARRRGRDMTWALLLRELHDRDVAAEPATVVHIRFRSTTQAEGFKRRVSVKGGQLLDKMATAPMLAGLAERCELRGQIEKEKDKAHEASERPSRRSWAGIRSSFPRRNQAQGEENARPAAAEA